MGTQSATDSLTLLLVLQCLGLLRSADAYCNAMHHAGYGPRTSTNFPPVSRRAPLIQV
jgi:hypothetical protein